MLRIILMLVYSSILLFNPLLYAAETDQSALYAHINFFSDPKTGDITIASIKKKLVDMHLSDAMANFQALLIDSFNQLKFTTTTGCPFAMNPAKYGVKGNHHAGTSRINKKDGTLNLQRLYRLENEFSENYDGKRIITKNDLQKFLDECRKIDANDKEDYRSDPLHIEQNAADAAWYAWFEFFTSGWKPIEGKPGQYEAYVTPEQIDQFFKHPVDAWMTVVNKEVPIAKPTT